MRCSYEEPDIPKAGITILCPASKYYLTSVCKISSASYMNIIYNFWKTKVTALRNMSPDREK